MLVRSVRPLFDVALLSLCAFPLLLTGCAGNSAPPVDSTPAATPPVIATQPASLTVPIGLDGIYTVTAAGSSLAYQWSLNSTPISGATTNSYTTPTVTAANTGEAFTVTVSNSAGSVTSQPAILTAGARAPKNGDLRFQQVDSLNTVNGYGIGTNLPEDFIDRGGEMSINSFGILDLGYEECAPGGPSPIGCVYFVTSFAQPSGVVPLATGFYGDLYDNFETDLSTGFLSIATAPFGGGPLLTPNTVITALAISTDDDRFALSYTQTSQPGGFDLAQHTIDPSQIQAAATQEGQSSRVITAIAFNAGQITYFSYGWTGDTTTVYETQAATATFDDVGTVATSLAAQGYIITAIGGDASDGIVLIGTRVQGDTLPRSILLSRSTDPQYIDLPAQGYAVVGDVNNFVANPGTSIAIGER